MRVSFEEAARMLLQGEVLAIPTDTVYGLAACFRNVSAIEEIYRIKERPKERAMIVLISNESQLSFLSNSQLPNWLTSFWPGPLTAVVPLLQNSVPAVVTAGGDTLAIRMPGSSQIRKLIDEVGPIVAPSANLHGHPSAKSEQDVEEMFGIDFPVLGSSEKMTGLESTIIREDDGRWKILREGAIPAQIIYDCKNQQ